MKFLLMIILTSGGPAVEADPESWAQPPLPTHSFSPIVYDDNETCHAAGREAVRYLNEHSVGGEPLFRCIPQGS